MKRTLIALALSAVTVVAQADTYDLATSHTFPIFEVKHMDLSTFRGRFDKTTGTLNLDLANKTGSVEATIDVNSVSTGVDKLNEHLKSPEFLDAAKYPTITFKSTELKFKGDKLAEVTGDLTIHGVTKPVTLVVKYFACHPLPPQMQNKPACGADAETTIKRSDFGVKYGIPMVGDEVGIEIEAEGYSK
jgi:polyisoprenoid-binding protein YceI